VSVEAVGRVCYRAVEHTSASLLQAARQLPNVMEEHWADVGDV